MNEDLFTPEEMDMYLLGVWSGATTTNRLSLNYHGKVSMKLEDGAKEGYGAFKESYQSPEWETFVKLRKNIYSFSSAKQYQQVRSMSKFINTNGEKSTFKEFKALAGVVFEDYNKNYLKTEYNTAIGQAQNAREWVKAVAEKDTFPTLEYHTQRDSHVRDEHAVLDGIKRPVNDPFWNSYMPKNGWNCRCFTVQLESTNVTDLKERDLSALNDEKKFPKEFRMNPGKDGLIFNPKFHPYFKVAPGDASLKANNFNLPR